MTPPPDPDAVGRLGAELLLPAEICQLLVQRGYGEPDAAKRFLRPRLEHVEAPLAMRDLGRAVDRLAEAVRRGETILVHGDYDVDGMCSTALVTRVLRALGAARVEPFVPHRADGYDLGPAGIAAARAAGASVVVTCDCGTSAHEAVLQLGAAGIDVIVTDHHLPAGPLPAALAVCNARRPDCPSRDKDLAAVGVAWKLAVALCEALGQPAGLAHRHLDLVALATIADVAPLRGENRVLVRYGLRLLAETPNAGLRALLRSSGLDGKPLTAGRVSFTLAPRLNAAGRIADAKLGLALLLTDDEAQANHIARQLEELNAGRQQLDRVVLDEALRLLDAPVHRDRFAHVLAGAGWHPGVIGIVASRVVEHTARPAVLVAVDQGVGKGSGRSIGAFDLHAALTSCAPLFQRYGGHRAAAGLTMDAAHLPAFIERFDDVARQRLQPEDLVPEVRLDLEVPGEALGEELERVLRHFEPFGVGNPSPVFAWREATLATPPRPVGRDRVGVRLQLRTTDGAMDAIGWGMADRLPPLAAGASLDVAGRLERDEYRGVSRLQLRLVDVRP